MTALATCFFCGRSVAVPVVLVRGIPRVASASACDHCGSRLDAFKFRPGDFNSEDKPVRNGGACIAPDLSTATRRQAKATEACSTAPFLRGVA